MLNKKPSARANHLKLAVIIPFVALFIWQFQTKIVAQEKDSPIQTLNQKPKIEILITKKTTDAFMEAQTKKLLKDHNIQLKFSKVKRNKNHEITAIKVELSDSKGTDSTHEAEDTSGIGNFMIVYNLETGNTEIGFYTEGIKTEEKVTAAAFKIPDTLLSPMPLMPPLPPLPSMPSMPPMPPMPTSPSKAPSLTAYQKMFSNIPKPPKPPKDLNNKSSMKHYDKVIQVYEDQMADYEQNIENKQKNADVKMENYEKGMASYERDMSDFEKKMEAFEKKMGIFEEKYFEYSKKLQLQHENSADSLMRTARSNFKPHTLDREKRFEGDLKKAMAKQLEIINKRRKMIEERKKDIEENRK